MLGGNSVVVAGGMESMSNVPHYATGVRGGSRLGHLQLVDGLLQDGLWDAYHDVHMGECAGAAAAAAACACLCRWEGRVGGHCIAALVASLRTRVPYPSPLSPQCPPSAPLYPAEMCAERLGISRTEQDEHAIASAERARAAAAAGHTDWELVPVEVAGGKGGAVAVVKEVSEAARQRGP